MVEHSLGKGEVESSILSCSTIKFFGIIIYQSVAINYSLSVPVRGRARIQFWQNSVPLICVASSDGLDIGVALLHKSTDGRMSPFRGQT